MSPFRENKCKTQSTFSYQVSDGERKVKTSFFSRVPINYQSEASLFVFRKRVENSREKIRSISRFDTVFSFAKGEKTW